MPEAVNIQRPQGRILAELCQRVAEHYQRSGSSERDFVTALPWLSFVRMPEPTVLNRGMLQPSMCIVLQGRKKMLIGDNVTEYGPGSYSLAAVDMPVSGQVTQASESAPYYGLRIDLDSKEIADLIVSLQITLPEKQQEAANVGAWVTQSDEALQDAFLRLVKVLDTPDDLPVMSKLIKQEILYRLVTSPSGATFWKQTLSWNQGKGAGEALAWIKRHFAEPLKIDELAKRVGMSTSSLHHRFKALTVMSPLQYQKQVRLLEARRLLLSGGQDVANVAWQVGYESPSQFNREYRRSFGAAPLQDVETLRQMGVTL
ncbi:AraC family transcriptional regulator [Buttiauxella sp. S04-F03]|uniref:AraC family transcriptional regulator n=1 Tax=Buttiauxella sp. W03-F01 TaxID=2904524 RepID=UPI001E4132A7|nr:AraC family transcriptional regulator [Buttiauxella sp. W03-F01]MCE0799298.1 AraC family transcriptional regulator [Buttiauxella sp. W03-F01]